MSVDGFLTFLALMIAAYAVLSPVNQLRLQLQFWQQIPLAVVSLAAVLFLEFYFELEHNFSNMFPALFEFFGFEVQGKWITPGKVAFLVVFMWLLVSFGLHLASKPNALNFKALYTLTERLVDERKFFELVELVIPYFRILRLADDKLLRIQKTHEWLKGFNARKTDPFAIFSQDKKIKVPLFFSKFLKYLALLIPPRVGATFYAEEILDLLCKSDALRNFLVYYKVELATLIMDSRGWRGKEFSSRYLRNLISDNTSHLFREVENNQNTTMPVGYFMNPQNKLLCFLFADPKKAVELGVWKPVGDEMIRMISTDTDYIRKLNEPPPNDDDLFKDPIFCGIIFFDIMVTSAARAGIADHMWLMYFSIVIREIEAVHNTSSPRVDELAEFPTLGNRLIYEAVSHLARWVRMINDLPENNFHRKSENLRRKVSIPYWAVVDLCKAIRSLVISENLSRRFVVYMYEMFLRTLSQLPDTGETAMLRTKMIEGVISGPHGLGEDDLSSNLLPLNDEVDHVILWDVKDYTDRL